MPREVQRHIYCTASNTCLVWSAGPTKRLSMPFLSFSVFRAFFAQRGYGQLSSDKNALHSDGGDPCRDSG